MRIRSIGLVCALLLVGGVVATEAVAAKKKCKRFNPAIPQSVSTDPTPALDAKVVRITDKATADNPLTISYEHSAAIADTLGGFSPFYLQEDPRFFNFQIVAKSPVSLLTMRLEWPAPSMSDIDLWIFDEYGGGLDSSRSYNPAYPAYGSLFGSDGDGNGVEQVADLLVGRCQGMTVESRPASTPGEADMVLKAWLS